MFGEWISCDDYMPEIGKFVIAFDAELWSETSSGGFHSAGDNVGEWWGDEWRISGQPANVTYWMPFPSAPPGAQ